jgi:hypothetical protein
MISKQHVRNFSQPFGLVNSHHARNFPVMHHRKWNGLEQQAYRVELGPYELDTCEPQICAARNGKITLHALTKGHYPGTRIPPDALPGLASIGFWDGVGPQDWGLNAHRNEGIEIHFLETGKMAFAVDGRRFNLVPGNMTITRPYCPKTRTTRKRNGCEQVCCNAGFDFLAPSITSPRSIERGR